MKRASAGEKEINREQTEANKGAGTKQNKENSYLPLENESSPVSVIAFEKRGPSSYTRRIIFFLFWVFTRRYSSIMRGMDGADKRPMLDEGEGNSKGTLESDGQKRTEVAKFGGKLFHHRVVAKIPQQWNCQRQTAVTYSFRQTLLVYSEVPL